MIAIIVSDFNPEITQSLLQGAEEVLKKNKVDFEVFHVPGAFEIPLQAKRLTKKFQVIIALGCILKGDTLHFDLVGKECARGCMKVSLEENVPIIFEVLTCFSQKDGIKRSSGKKNKGIIAAKVALFWLSHV